MVVQRHGRRGAAVTAATGIVALGLAATGCAGMGAAADAGPPAAESLAVLRRAADILVGSGSSRARTFMETATGGTRVTIRGTGAYDYDHRLGQLRVVLPRDAAGAMAHRPVTELLAPGALYMKDRGAGVPADKWVRVDTTELADGNLVTGGATDPLAAAELLRGARQVAYVGESKAAMDGAIVRHYRGTTDIRRAAKAASPQSRGPLEAAAKGFSHEIVPFDAYVDNQGRLRKVRHRFTFTGGSGRAGQEVVSTTELYGFGVPVRVELPEKSDIYAGKVAVSGA